MEQRIHGVNYLPLVSLCESKGVRWKYDTFTRKVTLSSSRHTVELEVGQSKVMVNGRPVEIGSPVDLYQGAIVVPGSFREQVFNALFAREQPVYDEWSGTAVSRIKRAVIDPGHGGRDPGAIGRSGLKEKDVNLDIAKRFKQAIESCGIEVIMTRDTDKFVSLDRRAETANNAKADFFFSVHANANHSENLNGFEVYYVDSSVSDSGRAYSAAKSASLNLDESCFASRSSELRAILWDMIFSSNRAESIDLADFLCQTMRRDLGVRISGVKSARFQVLREVQMPAVLIEVGYLSNKKEERRLKKVFYRQKVARALSDGICGYQRSLE